MNKVYTSTWNSLKTHPTPRWLQDGKFGIYTHWGVYSVPASRHSVDWHPYKNVTWYPYDMYREGTQHYQYHVKTYGPPSQFGYKDFIPMFTAEKFDPDEWAELFKKLAPDLPVRSGNTMMASVCGTLNIPSGAPPGWGRSGT